MLYALLSLTVVLLPALLFLLPGIRLWVLNRRWIPRGSVRTPFVRRVEAGLLLLTIAPVFVLWLYDAHDADFVPQAFSESVPAATHELLQQALWVGAAGCLVAVLLAWRGSTSWAALLLVCGMLGGKLYVQQVLSAQFMQNWDLQHNPTEPQELSDFPPMRVRFQLPDNLAGADLWINGVHVGKTPYQTTLQELLDEVPTWTHEDQRLARDEEDKYESWTYDANGHHGSWLDRWGWCPLHLPNSIPRPHESLFYKVDLGPLKGYGRAADQHTEGPPGAPDSVTVYELDTKFPVWEDQIEELLDRARLADYTVGPEWFAALASYQSYGRDRLREAIRTEPEFNRVRDDWTRHVTGLDGVNDPAAAWQVLMRIQNETREAGKYASDSLPGRAVDLLVPQLDPEQLCEYAVHLLETTPDLNRGSMQYGNDFFRTADQGEPPRPEAVAAWPIAQAVWRMDQRLDESSDVHDPETAARLSAESTAASAGAHSDSDARPALASLIDADRDNIVEHTVTPELLRMSYRDASGLRYVSILGGSAYERFLLRQDWRRRVTEQGAGARHVGNFENLVNEWFYQLMWLPGPVGREFRLQNASRLLELARNSVEEFELHTGSLPQDIDFLFLDRTWTANEPSLAMRFWDDVDRMAKLIPDHSQEQALPMRWNYLGRLWPESTVQMFVDAYAEQPLESRLYATLSDDIAPDDQVEIYSALLDFEVERHERLPDNGQSSMQNPAYVSDLNRQDLQRKLFDLPCEASAMLTLDQLQIEPGGPLRRDLPERMQVDTVHDDLVRLLAKSGEPAFQRMALTAIEHHPTPFRRAVLARLLEAEDEQVRKEAADVQHDFQSLAAQPLPHREIPMSADVTDSESESTPTAP